MYTVIIYLEQNKRFTSQPFKTLKEAINARKEMLKEYKKTNTLLWSK